MLKYLTRMLQGIDREGSEVLRAFDSDCGTGRLLAQQAGRSLFVECNDPSGNKAHGIHHGSLSSSGPSADRVHASALAAHQRQYFQSGATTPNAQPIPCRDP